MKGRSVHGRATPQTSAEPCRVLQTVSQVLAAARCVVATYDVATSGGPVRRDGVWAGCLGPLPEPAAADDAASASGVSSRERSMDRPGRARGLPVDRPRRGGLPPPGADRPVGACADRGRGAGALGGGSGARQGSDPCHGAPGQLGGARRLAGLAGDPRLGDLSSVPGGAARPLCAWTARAGRSSGHPGGRTAAAGVAGVAAGRGRGDSRGPGAAGRVGGVYVFRSGMSRISGSGAAGPGCRSARAPGLSGLSVRGSAGALRAGDRSGGDPGGSRLRGGRDGTHATPDPGPGGLDP